tara:strand:+ start:2159 stop:3055 length:897 start_codon:yes stop_codon:yes gene_type:complete
MKKRIWQKYWLILIILLASCNQTNTSSSPDNKNNCSNSTTTGYQTIIQDNVTREYILYIPSNYSATTATPLVINFHGFGGCANTYELETSMTIQAEANNFILAYPQGIIRAKSSTEWDPDTSSNNINDSDLAFVEVLINQISAQYNIESSRIYATGYSNGGMMAYGLACNKSNLIAGIGVVSGTMLQNTINNCSPTHPTALINFHSTADSVLPYSGNTNFPSVATAINYWKTYNNIPTANESETDIDSNTKKYTYSGGTNGVSIEHFEITNGGHIWFSQASSSIWAFLSNYNTSGLIP